VTAGRFRADLLYRLDVVPLYLPPLRERPEEILPLARHFLRPGVALDASAEGELCAWPWPGNVRELQNLLQRVGLLCDGGVVDGALVARWLQPATAAAKTVVLTGAPTAAGDPYETLIGRPLAEVELELVQRTLARCGGNRTRTAELLGIGVRTLYNKLLEPAGAGTAART